MSYLIGPNDPTPSEADEPHQHVPAGARTCGPECACRHPKPESVTVEKHGHEVPMSRSGFEAMGEPYFDEDVLRQVAPDQPVFLAARVGQLVAGLLFLMLAAWLGLELVEKVIEAYREVQDVL